MTEGEDLADLAALPHVAIDRRARFISRPALTPSLTHPNVALIERLYAGLNARDGDAMAACYHPEATFRDPVFGELRGSRVGDMWRMLTARGKDLRIETGDVRADDATGSVRWIATYSFGKARRPVRNVIEAHFEFREGLIWRHVDDFDVWKWAGMALGPPGRLLGWLPSVQARIRRDALRNLDDYTAETRNPRH